MTSIKHLLEEYVSLLVSYWGNLESLSKSDPTGSLKVDWLQANWELIVEGLLPDASIVLEPYGDGADCNGESSRVLYPDRIPNHRLVCTSLNGHMLYDFLNHKELGISEEEIIFDRFVCIGKDGWYYEALPFDKVLGEYTGEYVVIEFNKIDVQLQQIQEG